MNLKKLKKLFTDNGCRRVFYKVLAANDNSKNQFYLGGDFTDVSIIPCGEIYEERAENLPRTKRTKKDIFKADVNFSWITDAGQYLPAPKVRLIYYPQYPEIRMSGFLVGCRKGPSELIKQRQPGRILFLGITDTEEVFGYITANNSKLAQEIRETFETTEKEVLKELLLEKQDSKLILASELERIHRMGWIAGKKLSKKGCGPYNSSNAGGYTLEAELGIIANSKSEPDYMGWEIKQHGVLRFGSIAGRITLMTPEPTGGYYKEEGVEAFVRKFGYTDRRGRKDRLNFGGVYRVNKRTEITGLTMVLEGFNSDKKSIKPDGGICLITDKEEVAVKWHFTKILEHWKKKHNKAVYVPSMCRKETATRFYYYASDVRFGIETSIYCLLDALLSGKVYYDPGIKLENISSKPKPKERSQFRINSADVPVLYKQMTSESVI